jgi:hypothetical protein
MNRGTLLEIILPRTSNLDRIGASEEWTAAMGKAAGAVIAMFTMGAGVMTLLGSVLGAYAEAATLALVGMSLFAGSSVLSGGKAAVSRAEVAKEA